MRTNKISRKNLGTDRRGFALIELLVASAILGVILFAVMQVGTNLSQISVGAKFTTDFANLTSTMQSMINNASTCSVALASVASNSPFNSAAAQQTTTVPTGGMDVIFQLPGSTPTLIQGGGSYPNYGVNVTSLKLYNAIPAGVGAGGTTMWSAVLQLNATKANPQILGGASLASRDLGRIIFVVDASANILSCGGAVSNAQDACLAAGGVFNSTTNACQRCATYTVSGYGTATCYCPSNMNVPSAGAGQCNPGDTAGLISGLIQTTPSGYRQDCTTATGALGYSTCQITCCNM